MNWIIIVVVVVAILLILSLIGKAKDGLIFLANIIMFPILAIGWIVVHIINFFKK